MSEQDKQCREAFDCAVIELLGPAALSGGKLSPIDIAKMFWDAALSSRTPQAQLTDDHIRDATKLILTESEIGLLHDKHMFEAMDGYCMLDYQGFAKAIAARCGDEQLRQQRDELLEFAEFFIRTEGKAHPDSPTGKRLMIKAKQAIERGKG